MGGGRGLAGTTLRQPGGPSRAALAQQSGDPRRGAGAAPGGGGGGGAGDCNSRSTPPGPIADAPAPATLATVTHLDSHLYTLATSVARVRPCALPYTFRYTTLPL